MKKRVLASVLACAMAFHILSPLEKVTPEETASDHSIDRVTGNSTSPYYGTETQSTATLSTDSWDEIATLSLAEQLALSQFAPITGDSVVLGTEATPFLLSNVAQLQELGDYVNSGDTNFNRAHYKLTQDVSLSSVESWTPIGDYTYRFQGSFEGGGHVISNMTIYNTSTDHQGFFGYTENATVQNLGIENCNVSANNYVGALMGRASNASNISNCYVTGAVSGTNIVGGLVGNTSGSSIISNCYVTADVTGETNSGALVGYAGIGTIQNCYATGVVTGTSAIGGLVGLAFNEGTVIKNSVALNPSVSGTSFVNRVVGSDTASATLSDNYAWDGMTVNNSTVSEGTATNAHGEDLTYSTGLSKQFSEIFGSSNTAWNFVADKLPTLVGVGGNQSSELPSYMRNSATEIYISTVPQLQALATEVNTGQNKSGMTYILMNDLDLSSVANWTPIGSDSNKFKGTFDGNGYVISNLTIDNDSKFYQGLFGYTDGAIITKLGIENCSVVGTGGRYKAGLVGYVNNSTITYCYVTGSFFGINFTAGLVGTAQDSTITNCYATGAVPGDESNSTYMGGLVGSAAGSTNITNCYATGAVTGNNNIGGLVGSVDSSSTITNCYATGGVTGITSNVSGLVGSNYGTIKNSVALNPIVSNNGTSYRPYRLSYNSGTLTDNYAWEGMQLLQRGNLVAPIAIGATERDGADLTYSSPTLSPQLETIFNSSVAGSAWTYTDNGLPTLVDVGGTQSSTLPSHITGISVGLVAPPTNIYTVEDLQALATWVNAWNKCTGETYTLMNDLDLSGMEWTPIGTTSSIYFSGTFDGGGHVIRNMTIDEHTTHYKGLFGSTQGATIKNLGLENCHVTASKFYVGALVGIARATNIEKCYSTGAVSGNHVVGGLVGDVTNGSVLQHCYSTVTVTSNDMRVGGLVGYLTDSTVSNCYATGGVSVTGGSVGGLVGSAETSTISNSLALNPSVSGSGSYLHRVLGYNYNNTSTLTNNYAWIDMPLNGNKVTDGTASNQQGADLSVISGMFVKADGSSIYAVTAIFPTDIWNIPTASNGDYMILPTLIDVGNDKPSIYLGQNTASVTFDVGGGDAVAPMATVANKLPSLPTPTYTGYVFDGWYLETTYTNQVTTETEFLVSTTVYAKWLKIPTASDFVFNEPSDLEYDGIGKEATVTSTAVTGDITITYKSSSPSYDSTTAPTEIGIYTVEIDVEAKDDYVAVTGLTDGSWTFTINPAPVTSLDLSSYVTAPVKGDTPDVSTISDPQYTGTVTWSPTDSPFLGGTAYTATVTLTPTDNYTFTGVFANSFTYTDATVTNSADSGDVTIVFPDTEAREVVSIAVTTDPSKKNYIYWEDFVETGMEITATYDDLSEKVLTSSDYTITDGTALTVGKTTVEVSYTEGSVTTTVDVTGISVGNATITESVITPQSAVYTGSGISPTEPTGITVNSQTLTVMYSDDGGSTYSETAMPSYTDVDTYTVYYKLTAPNHEDVTGSIVFTIEKYTLTSPQDYSETVQKLTGEFTEPEISGVLTETVLGDFDYGTVSGTYGKTQAEVETILKANTSGSETIYYQFTPTNPNYTGTVTGEIVFTVQDIVFTLDTSSSEPSTTATYGDSWATIFGNFDPEDYVATVGSGAISGTYTLTVDSSTYIGTDFPEVGSYTWAVTFTGGAYSNVSVSSGSITIEPRELTLAWADLSLLYTGNSQTPTVTATNLVGTDTVDLTVSGGKTDVGTGYTATAELAASYTNYTLPSSPTTTFSIEKGSSDMNMPSISQNYSYGDVITVTFYPKLQTITTFSLSQNTAELRSGSTVLATATESGDGSYTLTYDTSEQKLAIDTHSLTVEYGGSGNLNSKTATFDLTLDKKAITATASTPMTKEYDGTTSVSGSFTLSPLPGDDVAVSSATGSFSDKNVGIGKNISFHTMILSGADQDFYDVSAPTGITGEITAKSLLNSDFPSRDHQYDVSEGNVSFTAPSFEYFSGEKVTGEVRYSYSTFSALTYEDLLAKLNLLVDGDKAELNYTMTLNGNYTGEITGEMDLTVIGIVISGVNEDTVEITANSSYGDKIDQIISLDKSNLSAKDGNGDPISGEFVILVNGTLYTGTDILKPDDYEWELVFRPADNSGDISLSTGDFTLSPLTVTLSWTGTNLFYTGDILCPTATISNKIGDDEVEVTVTGGQTDVGDYTATATTLTGADSGNYVLGSQVTKQFNISDPAQELADKLAELDSKSNPTATEIRGVETWYNALSQEAKAAINVKDSSLKPQLDAYIASLSTDSGGSGGSSGTGGTVVGSLTTPYVSVSVGGTISLTPKQAVNGTKVTITILPESGYELERISVKDSQAKEITVTKQGDGTYIFTQPLTKVTITVTFALISEPESESEPETEPEPELKPDAEEKPQTGYFTDVGTQYWYYDVVYEICDLGLMTGTKVTEFQPETSVTRGMIAQILYNLAEADSISHDSSFSDVPITMYYAIPIAWAEENGVVSGYADGTYRPENSVTREELAVLFYAFDRKFNQKPLSGYKSLQYSDNNMISPWAYEYVSWAVQQGLISGKLNDNIDPLGQAQRGELAQILLNYVAMKQS